MKADGKRKIISSLSTQEANRQAGLAALEAARLESSSQIDILRERRSVQARLLEVAREELARVEELGKRGLNTSADRNAALLRVGELEDELLFSQQNEAAVRISLEEARGRLADFDAQWRTALLSEAQSFWRDLNSQRVEREALEDRASLLKQWMNS